MTLAPRIDMKRKALLLVPALMGCATGILDLDPVSLKFDYLPLPPAEVGPHRAIAEGGARRVVVRGRIGTPTPCRTLDAEANRRGGVLELRVVARPTGETCVQTPGAYSYQAQLSGVEPGEHRIRVLHQLANTGMPEPQTVLDTTVTAR